MEPQNQLGKEEGTTSADLQSVWGTQSQVLSTVRKLMRSLDNWNPASFTRVNAILSAALQAMDVKGEEFDKATQVRKQSFVGKYGIVILGESKVSFTIPKGASVLDLLNDAQKVARTLYGRDAIYPNSLKTWSSEKAFTVAASKALKLSIDGNVPGSTDKTGDEQVAILKKQDLQLPEIEHLAAAHAAYFIATGKSLFDGNWVRASGGALFFVVLGLRGVGFLGDDRAGDVAASAALPSRIEKEQETPGAVIVSPSQQSAIPGEQMLAMDPLKIPTSDLVIRTKALKEVTRIEDLCLPPMAALASGVPQGAEILREASQNSQVWSLIYSVAQKERPWYQKILGVNVKASDELVARVRDAVVRTILPHLAEAHALVTSVPEHIWEILSKGIFTGTETDDHGEYPHSTVGLGSAIQTAVHCGSLNNYDISWAETELSFCSEGVSAIICANNNGWSYSRPWVTIKFGDSEVSYRVLSASDYFRNQNPVKVFVNTPDYTER